MVLLFLILSVATAEAKNCRVIYNYLGEQVMFVRDETGGYDPKLEIVYDECKHGTLPKELPCEIGACDFQGLSGGRRDLVENKGMKDALVAKRSEEAKKKKDKTDLLSSFKAKRKAGQATVEDAVEVLDVLLEKM